jgi:hypothetical protein
LAASLISKIRSSLSMRRTVGDRPRGPLKQWGNSHLNPRIKMS